MAIKFVNPSYSSVSCPKCGQKMKKVAYLYFSCMNYCYKNNYDIIIIINLNGGL